MLTRLHEAQTSPRYPDMRDLIVLCLLAVARGQVCDGQHQPCGSIQCSADETQDTMSSCCCGWGDSCCQCCSSASSSGSTTGGSSSGGSSYGGDDGDAGGSPAPAPSTSYPAGTFCAIISNTLTTDVMADLGCSCSERTDGLGVRGHLSTHPQRQEHKRSRPLGRPSFSARNRSEGSRSTSSVRSQRSPSIWTLNTTSATPPAPRSSFQRRSSSRR